MATGVAKRYPEQVAKNPRRGAGSTYPLPCKQLTVEVADQHHFHLKGSSSPKSVFRDSAPSGNSSYYSSSSSSAERASTTTDTQHQVPRPLHLVDRHFPGHDRFKLILPQQHHFEESTSLQQLTASSTAMDMNLSLNLKKAHMESGQQGQHLALRDVHNDIVPHKELPSYGQQKQFLNTTPSYQTSKPYGCYVINDSRGFPFTSGDEGMDKSSLSRYQATPLNSLINTLMQQYQPLAVIGDCKTARHESWNEVFATDLKSGKLLVSKWDEEDRRTNTKPNSAHLTQNGLTRNLPLFTLSHDDYASTLLSVEQESFSLHHPSSYDKVQLNSFEFRPRRVSADPSMWGKETLQDEVERLTDAVNCAQACLERIQPIPAPTNNMNPFQVQGVFKNRLDSMTAQGALQQHTRIDLQMTKSVLGSSHNPIATIGNRDLCWAPIKFDERQRAHNGNGLSETQASQKHRQRPTGAQNGIAKPWIQEDGFTKVGEHFHVQRAEKSGPTRSSTSCMMDASTEITPTVSHRDMGTQMTPIGSSRCSSRPHSPRRGTPLSPPRHNTPMKTLTSAVLNVGTVNGVEVERFHKTKLGLDVLTAGVRAKKSLGKSFDSNWSSREEEEEDIGKSLRQLDLEALKKDVLEARATAWKEATRLKVVARYEREETKIRAWEDLQAAKADADLKKLEMKLEKQRVQTASKIASRLDAAHRKAEERRAAVKAHSLEALEKTADKIIHHEATLSHHALCACFSQPFG